jgi:hypothetical protein
MSNTVNKTKEEIIEYWVGMGGLNVHTGNRGLILGMMTEWADQQTATLQSELAEKDKEIKRMREALQKTNGVLSIFIKIPTSHVQLQQMSLEAYNSNKLLLTKQED